MLCKIGIAEMLHFNQRETSIQPHGAAPIERISVAGQPAFLWGRPTPHPDTSGSPIQPSRQISLTLGSVAGLWKRTSLRLERTTTTIPPSNTNLFRPPLLEAGVWSLVAHLAAKSAAAKVPSPLQSSHGRNSKHFMDFRRFRRR